MEPKLQKQIDFLIEIDQMKNILRQTLLADGSRRENDAEHSWHLAMTAMVFIEYASPDVDLSHVLKMILVHDLVEVYAGDTFAYDPAAAEDKAQREEDAAQSLFGILPAEQGLLYYSYWKEFEAMETQSSQFANAMDRFQPFLNNTCTGGHTWKLGHVKKQQVLTRMDPIRRYVPALWGFIESNIDTYCKRGIIEQ